MRSDAGSRSFPSFFLGGFECSSQRRADGRRLDLLATTGHDRLVLADYRLLREQGIHAARDGLRWHLIEALPGQRDWSSFLPMLHAARDAGIQVIWDLCHYGWPDDLNIWSEDFLGRFADFAADVARLVRAETSGAAFFCPVNEISFWAWAGGEMGLINPLGQGEGGRLKRQLVRASIAAISAIRAVDPHARFVTAEPLIHVAAGSEAEEHIAAAEGYRILQYEALDLLSGRIEPELGGSPDFIDLVGLNFYPDNQWYHGGSTIPLGHHAYRPLSEMLAEASGRYGRPIFLAETGAEGSARPAWLHYVCDQVRQAMATGVPVEGICLYPILDYPGWNNDRLCHVGMFSLPDRDGWRGRCQPMIAEMRRQAGIFAEAPAAQRPEDTAFTRR